MPSAFVTCLIFSCYFLDMWNWVSFGQDTGSYPKATLEVSPGNVIARGGTLTFRCVGPYSPVRFILYRGSAVHQTQDPLGSEARFLLTDLQPADEGAYACRYHPRTGPTIYSDASDIIQIKVLDEEPKKPDKSDKKDDISSTTLIISVVCSVLLVIALIAVIIVYIKHKTNKAGSDSQKSSLSKGAEEIERAAETTYASVGRGEQRDTAITTEGACQEEYLTYAVINKDALKKPKWAPSSEPAEATVYASVNVQ